jgi:hypothetical protein
LLGTGAQAKRIIRMQFSQTATSEVQVNHATKQHEIQISMIPTASPKNNAMKTDLGDNTMRR